MSWELGWCKVVKKLKGKVLYWLPNTKERSWKGFKGHERIPCSVIFLSNTDLERAGLNSCKSLWNASVSLDQNFEQWSESRILWSNVTGKIVAVQGFSL